MQTEQDRLYVAGHEAYHVTKDEFAEIFADMQVSPEQLEAFISSLDVSEVYKQYLRENPDIAREEMIAVEIGNTVADTDRKSYLSAYQVDTLRKNRDLIVNLLSQGLGGDQRPGAGPPSWRSPNVNGKRPAGSL